MSITREEEARAVKVMLSGGTRDAEIREPVAQFLADQHPMSQPMRYLCLPGPYWADHEVLLRTTNRFSEDCTAIGIERNVVTYSDAKTRIKYAMRSALLTEGRRAVRYTIGEGKILFGGTAEDVLSMWKLLPVLDVTCAWLDFMSTASSPEVISALELFPICLDETRSVVPISVSVCAARDDLAQQMAYLYVTNPEAWRRMKKTKTRDELRLSVVLTALNCVRGWKFESVQTKRYTHKTMPMLNVCGLFRRD